MTFSFSGIQNSQHLFNAIVAIFLAQITQIIMGLDNATMVLPSFFNILILWVIFFYCFAIYYTLSFSGLIWLYKNKRKKK